jgi:hypothetical protein
MKEKEEYWEREKEEARMCNSGVNIIKVCYTHGRKCHN